MARNQEIEIKFAVESLPALARKRAAGFRRVKSRTLEMNSLYDLPGQSLRKKGEVLRLCGAEHGGRAALDLQEQRRRRTP